MRVTTVLLVLLSITTQGCGKVPADIALALQKPELSLWEGDPGNPVVTRGTVAWQLVKGRDDRWTGSQDGTSQSGRSSLIAATHAPADPALPTGWPDLVSLGEVTITSFSDDDLWECGGSRTERCRVAMIMVRGTVLSGDQGADAASYYFWLPGWDGVAGAMENLPLLLYELPIQDRAQSVSLADFVDPPVFNAAMAAGLAAEHTRVRLAVEYALRR